MDSEFGEFMAAVLETSHHIQSLAVHATRLTCLQNTYAAEKHYFLAAQQKKKKIKTSFPALARVLYSTNKSILQCWFNLSWPVKRVGSRQFSIKSQQI